MKKTTLCILGILTLSFLMSGCKHETEPEVINLNTPTNIEFVNCVYVDSVYEYDRRYVYTFNYSYTKTPGDYGEYLKFILAEDKDYLLFKAGKNGTSYPDNHGFELTFNSGAQLTGSIDFQKREQVLEENKKYYALAYSYRSDDTSVNQKGESKTSTHYVSGYSDIYEFTFPGVDD